MRFLPWLLAIFVEGPSAGCHHDLADFELPEARLNRQAVRVLRPAAIFIDDFDTGRGGPTKNTTSVFRLPMLPYGPSRRDQGLLYQSRRCWSKIGQNCVMMALRGPSKYVDRCCMMLPFERSIRRILIAFVRQDECHPPLEMLRLVATDRVDDRILYHLYPSGYWIFGRSERIPRWTAQMIAQTRRYIS